MEIEQRLIHLPHQTSPPIKGTKEGSLSVIHRSLGSLENKGRVSNIEVSGADNNQSVGGEAAMVKGEKPEARGVVISQSSKASICPVMKIKLVAELQMMLPSGH